MPVRTRTVRKKTRRSSTANGKEIHGSKTEETDGRQDPTEDREDREGGTNKQMILTADGKEIDADFNRNKRSRDEKGKRARSGGPAYRLWRAARWWFTIFFGRRGGGLAIGFECLKLAFGDVTRKDVQEVLPEVSFGLNAIDP